MTISTELSDNREQNFLHLDDGPRRWVVGRHVKNEAAGETGAGESDGGQSSVFLLGMDRAAPEDLSPRPARIAAFVLATPSISRTMLSSRPDIRACRSSSMRIPWRRAGGISGRPRARSTVTSASGVNCPDGPTM